MKRFMCMVMLSALVFAHASVFAADTATHIDATLKWNANTESDLACYKVYKSAVSGEYGAPMAILEKTKTEFVTAIAREQMDKPWFFTLTACDVAGNESAKSNEVSKLIAAVAAIPKPGTPILTVTPGPGKLTVTWPNVADGIGGVAKVNVRYSLPPLQWGTAISAECETSPCEINELAFDTAFEVRGVAYRAVDAKNIFGDITAVVQTRTLPAEDPAPMPPQGLIISKAEEDEVVIVASAEHCVDATVSALGTTDGTHRLTVKCVK